MKNPRYTVAVQTEATEEHPAGVVEHTVTVKHGDRLRAELEMPKNGLPTMEKAPMHTTTCWVWAALTREGKYGKPFAVFLRTDCVDLEAEDTPEDTPADPTSLATGSHSL